ncbi:unnamed protein product [Larinioides sclopetarius]|uniref:Uncharacterized protein n=1 Tax=Larinioides sclopetarius TaxID=280406 RepID=A0AAV2BHR6_9ARAC
MLIALFCVADVDKHCVTNLSGDVWEKFRYLARNKRLLPLVSKGRILRLLDEPFPHRFRDQSRINRELWISIEISCTGNWPTDINRAMDINRRTGNWPTDINRAMDINRRTGNWPTDINRAMDINRRTGNWPTDINRAMDINRATDINKRTGNWPMDINRGTDTNRDQWLYRGLAYNFQMS